MLFTEYRLEAHSLGVMLAFQHALLLNNCFLESWFNNLQASPRERDAAKVHLGQGFFYEFGGLRRRNCSHTSQISYAQSMVQLRV